MKRLHLLAFCFALSLTAIAQEVDCRKEWKSELSNRLDTATVEHAYNVIKQFENKLLALKGDLPQTSKSWAFRSMASQSRFIEPEKEKYGKKYESKDEYTSDRQEAYLEQLYFWQSIRYPDSNVQLYSGSGTLGDNYGIDYIVKNVFYADGSTYMPDYKITQTLLTPTAKVVDSIQMVAHCKSIVKTNTIHFTQNTELLDGLVLVKELKNNYAKIQLFGSARSKVIKAMNKDGKYLTTAWHQYTDLGLDKSDLSAVTSALPKVKALVRKIESERRTITVQTIKDEALLALASVEYIMVCTPYRTLDIFFEGNIHQLEIVDEVTAMKHYDITAHNAFKQNNTLLPALDSNSRKYGFVDTEGNYAIHPDQFDSTHPNKMRDLERINTKYYMQEVVIDSLTSYKKFFYLDEENVELVELDNNITDLYSYNGMEAEDDRPVACRPANLLPPKGEWHDMMVELGVIVEKNKKKAFFSNKNRDITGFEYDAILPISLTRLAVQKEKLWALMDLSGKLITKFEFNKFEVCRDGGDILVIKNGKYQFIDAMGNLKLNLSQYRIVHPFVQGLAKVGKGNRYGFIDTTGKVVIPLVYSQTSNFFVGNFIMGTSNQRKQALIRNDGALIKPFEKAGSSVLVNDNIRHYYFEDMVYDQYARPIYRLPIVEVINKRQSSKSQ